MTAEAPCSGTEQRLSVLPKTADMSGQKGPRAGLLQRTCCMSGAFLADSCRHGMSCCQELPGKPEVPPTHTPTPWIACEAQHPVDVSLPLVAADKSPQVYSCVLAHKTGRSTVSYMEAVLGAQGDGCLRAVLVGAHHGTRKLGHLHATTLRLRSMCDQLCAGASVMHCEHTCLSAGAAAGPQAELQACTPLQTPAASTVQLQPWGFKQGSTGFSLDTVPLDQSCLALL